MWFVIRPLDRTCYYPYFIEIKDKENFKYLEDVFKKYLELKGISSDFSKYNLDPDGAHPPVRQFSTLDYASAWERGCNIKITSCGVMMIEEKQREPITDIDGIDFIYTKLEKFKNIYSPQLFFNNSSQQVIDKLKKQELLNQKPFDGVCCRQCNGYIQYGEPDNLIEDNKRTCFSCINYLISLRKWPYKKENNAIR